MRIDAERAGATRDEYQRALADENIGTSIHFLPVHRLTAYRELYPDQPPLPVAERAGRRGAVAAALAGALGRRHRGRDRRAAARARARSPGRREHRSDRLPTGDAPRVGACPQPPVKAAAGSSSPGSASPTSSGRSTSARRSTSSARASSATSSARSRSWRSPSGRWPGAGSGCSARAGSTTTSAGSSAPTSPPTPPARCCRRRSAATRRGSTRRRGAIPGRAAPVAGSVLLERALGGVGDAGARRDRLRARDRPLRRRRLPLGRAGVRRRDRRRRLCALLAPGARAARAHAAAAAPAPARAAAARRLRGHPRLPRPRAAADRRDDPDARRPGRARAGDLADRQGRRRRPLAAPVLRDGAAALPRHARAVHDQRAGRARGVLRQLPRPARRQRRPRLRDRLPLLRRHDRARAARRGDPRLGEPQAGQLARPSQMAER